MTTGSSASGRRHRRHALIALLFFVALAMYVGYTYFPSYAMKAMNRQQATQAEFDKYVKELHERPLYKAGPDGAPVTFKFSLSPALLPDTLLLIKPSGSPPVYVGPYQDTIVIQAGSDLRDSDGYGNVMIALFRKESREIYVAEQSSRFWQPNRTVRIEFLSERVIDEKTSLPMALKVYAE